jgi:hypothetical protein
MRHWRRDTAQDDDTATDSDGDEPMLQRAASPATLLLPTSERAKKSSARISNAPGRRVRSERLAVPPSADADISSDDQESNVPATKKRRLSTQAQQAAAAGPVLCDAAVAPVAGPGHRSLLEVPLYMHQPSPSDRSSAAVRAASAGTVPASSAAHWVPAAPQLALAAPEAAPGSTASENCFSDPVPKETGGPDHEPDASTLAADSSLNAAVLPRKLGVPRYTAYSLFTRQEVCLLVVASVGATRCVSDCPVYRRPSLGRDFNQVAWRAFGSSCLSRKNSTSSTVRSKRLG